MDIWGLIIFPTSQHCEVILNKNKASTNDTGRMNHDGSVVGGPEDCMGVILFT